MKGDELVIRYAMKGKTTQDLMHSSGYAKIQPSATSSSNDSFTARQTLDRNRQFVHNYRDSQISSQRNDFQRARTYSRTEDKGLQQDSLSASERRARFSSSEQARSFSRPATPGTGGAPQSRAPQIPTRRMGI